ncbi:MAG: DUF2721 domain-containing protein [Anaerolineales bacterium]|nr:DUF2721 domain-containing protein [Anaerolineales bacterium]
MELTLTTPALLFPAISLLLLAYTNRFLTLASLIRSLHDRWASSHEEHVRGQISNLRYRIRLIRNMQIYGVSSFFLCVLCMFMLYAGQQTLGAFTFGAALIVLLVSLALSLREVQISVDALTLELRDLEERN